MLFKRKTNEEKLAELDIMRKKRMEYAANAEINKMHSEEKRKLREAKAQSSTFRRVASGVAGDIKKFGEKHIEFNPQGQQGSMFGHNRMFGEDKQKKENKRMF